MTKHFALVFVIGCSLLVGTNGFMNLLGPDVNFPLIHWTAETIFRQVIDQDSEFFRTCQKNNAMSALQTSQAKFRTCITRFGGTTPGGSGPPQEMCKKMNEMIKCIHNAIKSMARACQFDEEEIENSDHEIASYNGISEKMCKDNMLALSDFMRNQGSTCQQTKNAELKRCASDNKKENMKYDKSGCMAAKKFVDCSYDALKDCNSKAAMVAKDVMMAGLDATPCKMEDGEAEGEAEAENGSSATPLHALLVILGCVFARQFL